MSFSQYCLVICLTTCLCFGTDVLAIEGSEVLDNLKRYDSIYESGFTVSGTRKRQERVDLGQFRINVERGWRLAFEGDRCGYLMEVLEYEKPKFQEPKGGQAGLTEDGWQIVSVRARRWGYWGSDVSGDHYEDMVMKVSPENEIVEMGKGYESTLYSAKDPGPTGPKRTFLWSLGRFFSKNIDEVTLVKSSTNGHITVSALGKKGEGRPGRWELEIEPAAAWMVREARFYSDTRPDVIDCEMKNRGTGWSGPYCIPQHALFNYGGPIEGGTDKPDELTFGSLIEEFDEELYSGAQQAVTKDRPPKLSITDFRVSPPLIFQPDELSSIASDIALDSISANALSNDGFADANKVVAKSTSIDDTSESPPIVRVTIPSVQSAPVSPIARRPWYLLPVKWAVVVSILAVVIVGCACVFLFRHRHG